MVFNKGNISELLAIKNIQFNLILSIQFCIETKLQMPY